MTGNRRVVVTGLGVVAAPGANVEEFWAAVGAGRPAVGPIESVDRAQLRFQHGAEVKNFDPRKHFDEKQIDLLDRFSMFGLVAAREAVARAGIEWTPELRERTAVVTGSCLGGRISDEQVTSAVYAGGGRRAHPLTIPRVMANVCASHVSTEFGLAGRPLRSRPPAPPRTTPSATRSCWCARAWRARRWRAGAKPLRARSSEGVGGPARRRAGHLPALLEEPRRDDSRRGRRDARARNAERGARGAKIYAELVGFGMSADAHHVTQPSAEGAARAVRAALEDAGLRPEQIGYVNAHGTGTAANDPTETRALRLAFGRHADRLAVSSTKSVHGHTLGAAGAVEAVATLLALRHQTLPPTANFVEPDPECDLDCVPNEPRRAEFEYAVSNSFAFGGLNAVTVFRRC